MSARSSGAIFCSGPCSTPRPIAIPASADSTDLDADLMLTGVSSDRPAQPIFGQRLAAPRDQHRMKARDGLGLPPDLGHQRRIKSAGLHPLLGRRHIA